MARVATYVFIDMETTGLPAEEFNRTRITELSMVAVKRTHLLDSGNKKDFGSNKNDVNSSPRKIRVQHKLTLCLYPRRMISDVGTTITGLSNDLLVNEPVFDLDVYNLIAGFLNILEKPVCLVAHNGLHYDYPILKNHITKLKVSLAEDLLCADSYHGFYDILEKQFLESNGTELAIAHSPSTNGAEILTETTESNKIPYVISTSDATDKTDFYTNNLAMQAINETSPKKLKNLNINRAPIKGKRENVKRLSKVCRRMPWGDGVKPNQSYKLGNVYERVLKRKAVDGHRAENDCIFMMEIATALSENFVKWVDDNCVEFKEIVPMSPGVPL